MYSIIEHYINNCIRIHDTHFVMDEKFMISLVLLNMLLVFNVRSSPPGEECTCPTTFTCSDDVTFQDGWGATCSEYSGASAYLCKIGGACVDCNWCPCKVACGLCTMNNVYQVSCFDCIQNQGEQCIDGEGPCGSASNVFECPSQCTERFITEFKGDEITELSGHDADSCCDECISRSNCVGWTLDGVSNADCTLFSDIEEAKRKTGKQSGCHPDTNPCPSS